MTARQRTRLGLVSIWILAIVPARALFNLNEGKDLIFVTATYSIGFDSNVFTRASGKQAFTQSTSLSVDYTRQAGLIAVSADASISAETFAGLAGQNFADPAVSISFRKRYGRTTGSLSFSGRKESQPDPDAGERTKGVNYTAALSLRYPVNDRYYFTGGVNYNSKFYLNNLHLSDISSYSASTAINYVYTSKLDLNGSYSVSVSKTSKNSNAVDQSVDIGASGTILPKLSGSISLGVDRRDNDSTTGGREHFYGFNAGTSLKWLFSRRISFNANINDGFSTTSTDLSVDRLNVGLHGNFNFLGKYVSGAGVSWTHSNFLGKAGAGRVDDMLQFDASLGLALTTHIRTSLSYMYQVNYSNSPGASFERETLSLTASVTY